MLPCQPGAVCNTTGLCFALCRSTGDNNGASTQHHLWPSPGSCNLTPTDQADVATLREVLRGRSRRCARREHSRLLWVSNPRTCGVAPASATSDHFRQSLWATNGRVSAEDVARGVLQHPRIQLWALNPLHFAASGLVLAPGGDRSTVVCKSRRPTTSTTLLSLCPTWPTALRSTSLSLWTSCWNQRLAPLENAFSATPRPVLPDDVAPRILRSSGRQQRGSDSRSSGPSLGAAAALRHVAKLSCQPRAKT